MIKLSTTQAKYIFVDEWFKEVIWFTCKIEELRFIQECMNAHYNSQSVNHLTNHYIMV